MRKETIACSVKRIFEKKKGKNNKYYKHTYIPKPRCVVWVGRGAAKG
jgi:hypothetical protein